jgi:DNA repair protein RadC
MPRKPSVIRDGKDIYALMKGISRYKRERMYSILLDGESVIGIEKVSKGSEGLVDTPPEVAYRTALERDCKSIILVHNHPSGFPYPSDQDRKATRNLYRWGRNMGIDLRDSVIIALGGYYSFEESGVLQAWREQK